MGDKALRKGLSITAIVLVAIVAFVTCFSETNGILFGHFSALNGEPFIAAFAIPLLAVLIVLARYCTSTDTADELIASIGVRYAIFGWFFIFLIHFADFLWKLFAYDFYIEHFANIYLAMNSFNVCVVGTVVLGLSMRKLPVYKIEKRKLKIGHLLLLIMMMYGLTQVGMVMGMPIHLVLSAFSPAEDLSSLPDMLLTSNPVLRIISVGILPAIFEELLFRKFCIDRTIRHGEFISCAMSGIMFGLWHGNFQQFFFTFFVGVMFAFVYIRTGNVIYTMIMHASMNLVTSTITLNLLTKLMESAGMDLNNGAYLSEPTDEMIMSLIPILLLTMIWVFAIFSFQVVGFIMLMVKRKKFKLIPWIGELSRKQLLHKLTHSVEMWIFFAFAIFRFMDSYLPSILAFILQPR